MHTRTARLVLMGLMLALISVPAFAQGTSTSSLAGVVVDSSGGALPGATITAKNDNTGATFTTVSSATGDFNIPAMPIGTYSVTVSLQSFKTVVLSDVVLNVGVPATVRATLEVGDVTETVEVTAAGQMVKTQTTTISSTISTTEIANTPLTSRYLLDFVTSLPGVNTPAGNRNSTINGLDQSAINITLDGINIQDNTLKTGDGFFAIVSPRLDAIEEVTVSGAAQTADSAGTGAVQIKFVTRSGSNNYTGSGYWYYRSDTLNANTYFNERDGVDKAKLQQNQPGFRVGGPIVIPGLYDGHNQAFFFVNYEEFRQPSETTRTRTILSPLAQQGIFQYGSGGSVDLYSVAAANGITSTPDPVVRQLLADIRSAASSTGSIEPLADPNLERFRYNVSVESIRRYPTFRVDVNMSEKHRVSGSFNYNKFTDYPDTLNSRDATFPGFPAAAGQSSKRFGVSTSLRSTLTANMVNEVRIGGSGAPVLLRRAQQGHVVGPARQPGRLRARHQRRRHHQRRPQLQQAVAQCLHVPLRGHPQLAEGQPRDEHRRVLLGRAGLAAERQPAALDRVRHPPGRPGQGRPQLIGQFPGLVERGPRAGREHLRHARRLGQLDWRQCGHQPGHQSVRVSAGDLPGRPARRLRVLVPGCVAAAARPHAQPRPPLGAADPVQVVECQLLVHDARGRVGHFGSVVHLHRRERGQSADCNLFKPGLQPGKPITEYYEYAAGREAYNMDWDNFAPSVGAAWTPSRDGSGWLRGSSATPATRSSGRAGRAPSSVTA